MYWTSCHRKQPDATALYKFCRIGKSDCEIPRSFIRNLVSGNRSGAREGNYLESSATALFIYTLAKAINKGYIGNEYIEPTQKAFDGMVKTFTRLEEDGSYTITNCCAVAGLGGDSKDIVTAHLSIISVNRS